MISLTANLVSNDLDNLASQNELFSGFIEINDYESGCYSSNDFTNLLPYASWRHKILNVNEGDKFIINAHSSSTTVPIYAFLDDENNPIIYNRNSITAVNLEIITPKNATKLILNDNNSYKKSYKNTIINNEINRINYQIYDINHMNRILFNSGGEIKLNYNLGTIVSLEPIVTLNSATYQYAIVEIEENIDVIINASNNLINQIAEARPYAFLDSNFKLLFVAATGTYKDLHIKSPSNSKYLIINRCSIMDDCYFGLHRITKIEERCKELNDSIINNNSLIDEYNLAKESNLENFEFINENTTINDILNFEKVDCIHHDNFHRNDADIIGYNGNNEYKMDYNALGNEQLNVCIRNNICSCINSNYLSESTIILKTVDPQIFPYKILLATDYSVSPNAFSQVALNIENQNRYVFIQLSQTAISINNNNSSYSVETTTINNITKTNCIQVYVYSDKIKIFDHGIKIIEISVDMHHTLCGLRFRAGNDYNSSQPIINKIFNVYIPSKFIPLDINHYLNNAEDSINVIVNDGEDETIKVNTRNNLFMNILGAFQTNTAYGCNVDSIYTLNNNKSLRFYLKEGDPKHSNGTRAELRLLRPKKDITLHSKLMIFNIFIPESYDSDSSSELIMQMHDVADGINVAGLSPGISLTTWRTNITLNTMGYTGKVIDKSEVDEERITITPINKGEWTNIIIYLREGYMEEHDPITAAWVNGKLKLVTNHLNAYNEPFGSYIKIGMYKNSWNTVTERTIWFNSMMFYI